MPRTAYLVAGLVLAALVLSKFSPSTGLTSLIRFGDATADSRPSSIRALPIAIVANSKGYDGQFYAAIALSPTLRDPELPKSLDAPAYRARRILVPAVASFLGVGLPWWTLQAYALLNVVCWFTLGWLLGRSIGGSDWVSFGRWIGCMFSLGVLDSVRQSLVDLPALLMLVLAVDSHEQSRSTNSTWWLALGNLTKETSLLSMLALQCEVPLALKSWKRLLFFAVIAMLPLGLWAAYVQYRFIGSSGGAGLGNFDWPFVGMAKQGAFSLGELFSGNFDGRHSFALLAIISLFVQSWVIWRSPHRPSPWWRIGVAYSLLGIFLSLWVWSGYWAVCRAVLPLTVAFNLLLPANRLFWPLWIVGNITLVHGVWRFL